MSELERLEQGLAAGQWVPLSPEADAAPIAQLPPGPGVLVRSGGSGISELDTGSDSDEKSDLEDLHCELILEACFCLLLNSRWNRVLYIVPFFRNLIRRVQKVARTSPDS